METSMLQNIISYYLQEITEVILTYLFVIVHLRLSLRRPEIEGNSSDKEVLVTYRGNYCILLVYSKYNEMLLSRFPSSNVIEI